MKKPIALSLSIFLFLASRAQVDLVKEINQVNTPSKGLAALRFLASDELMGRATARPEIHVAARYIAESFRSSGLKEVPGTIDYFQNFDIRMAWPSNVGSLVVKGKNYELNKQLLEMSGKDVSITAPIVYVHHATEKDLSGLDLKGKIVLSDMGSSDNSTFMEGFFQGQAKRKAVQDKGALAIVERFNQKEVPWDDLRTYLNTEHPILEEESENLFPAILVNDQEDNLVSLIGTAEENATLNISGSRITQVPAKNVMAWIEGTDAALKKQFVVLTAHYDHLGVAKKPQMEEGKMDSIYNGARDNAIGTTAVLDAARFFAEHPPRRSMLFIAYTGEEIGEVGSWYFSNHPLIPLKQIVFNLNIDNASYNDTTIISVIGLGRTSADADIQKACRSYGLKAMPDPAPEQNLFDRSDNVNLAVKGIPAPCFSLGIKKFDDEINKRYHQLSDEVGNFNLRYAMKYINSFILASKLIADNPVQPTWVKGDKYEAAWKKLYQ